MGNMYNYWQEGSDRTSQKDSYASEQAKAKIAADAKLQETYKTNDRFMKGESGQINSWMSPSEQGAADTRNQALSDINMLYGESPMSVGKDARNYSDQLRGGTQRDSLKADLMRKTSMNDLYRGNAKAGLKGVDTAGASANLSRRANYEADAYNQEYKDKQLDKYGKNIGSRLSGQYGVMTGKDAQALANIAPTLPSQSKGMFDSIICGELFAQSKISLYEYQKAGVFGLNQDSDVFNGYLIIAKPIVALMKKSDKFSGLFVNWAKTIRHNKITKTMIPVCRVIGKISSLFGVKYVTAK